MPTATSRTMSPTTTGNAKTRRAIGTRWRTGIGVVAAALMASSTLAAAELESDTAASPGEDGPADTPEFETNQATAQSAPTPTVQSVTPLPSDGTFSDVAVTKDGKFALVLGENKLSKVRLAPGDPKVVGTTPNVYGNRVVVHPNGRFAYAIGPNGGPIQAVNISKAKPRLVRRAMPNVWTSDIVVSPDGRWLYAMNGSVYSDWNKHGLYVFSLAKPGQPKRVAWVQRTNQHSGEMVITPNGNRVITTSNHAENHIYRYDVSAPKNPKLAGKRKMSFKVDQLAISPGGGRLYTSGQKTGQGGTALMFAKLGTPKLAVKRIRGPFSAGRYDLEVAPSNRYVVGAGWAPSTDVGFLVFGTKPFKRLGAYADIDHSANGSLAFSYAGPTKGNFYQVVNTDGQRVLIQARLIA